MVPPLPPGLAYEQHVAALSESEQNRGSLHALWNARYHSTPAWTARRSRAASFV